jgi:hypothetical protein
MYEGVSKSFRTGRLERELQMVQLSATGCSCVAILWVSLVSFAAITLCVASQLVFAVYFVIDSVRELFHTSSERTSTPASAWTFSSVSFCLLHSIARPVPRFWIVCISNKVFLFLFQSSSTPEHALLHESAASEGVSKSSRAESVTKYTLTTINTRWEAIQRVMSAKLTTLTHKITA